MFSLESARENRRPRSSVVRNDADADANLLAGLLADDPAAWREFNTRFSRLMYSCITRITSRFGSLIGQDDIREIYANLCLQLLANDKKKLKSFEPERGNKLSSWLGLLATHVTYDYLRCLKREPRWDSLAEAEQLSGHHPDPFETSVQLERAEILKNLVSGFSDKDREFIQLYYGEGLAPERVAREMGISVKTVYSKKHKVTGRLSALLSERQLAA